MRTKTMYLLTSLLLLSGTPEGFATQLGAGAAATGQSQDKTSALSTMTGKQILGKSREFLGILVSLNGADKTAKMKTPTGAVVPIPMDQLSVEEDHVRATISRGDVLALIRETGQAGVFEVGAPQKPIK